MQQPMRAVLLRLKRRAGDPCEGEQVSVRAPSRKVLSDPMTPFLGLTVLALGGIESFLLGWFAMSALAGYSLSGST